MANGIRAEYAKRAEANTIQQDDLFGADETFNTEMALRAKYAGDQLARINLDLRALKIVSGKQSGNVAAKDSLLKKYNIKGPDDAPGIERAIQELETLHHRWQHYYTDAELSKEADAFVKKSLRLDPEDQPPVPLDPKGNPITPEPAPAATGETYQGPNQPLPDSGKQRISATIGGDPTYAIEDSGIDPAAPLPDDTVIWESATLTSAGHAVSWPVRAYGKPTGLDARTLIGEDGMRTISDTLKEAQALAQERSALNAAPPNESAQAKTKRLARLAEVEAAEAKTIQTIEAVLDRVRQPAARYGSPAVGHLVLGKDTSGATRLWRIAERGTANSDTLLQDGSVVHTRQTGPDGLTRWTTSPEGVDSPHEDWWRTRNADGSANPYTRRDADLYGDSPDPAPESQGSGAAPHQDANQPVQAQSAKPSTAISESANQPAAPAASLGSPAAQPAAPNGARPETSAQTSVSTPEVARNERKQAESDAARKERQARRAAQRARMVTAEDLGVGGLTDEQGNGPDFMPVRPEESDSTIKGETLAKRKLKPDTNVRLGFDFHIDARDDALKIAKFTSSGEDGRAHRYAARNIIPLVKRAGVAVRQKNYNDTTDSRVSKEFERLFIPYFFEGRLYVAVVSQRYQDVRGVHALETLDVFRAETRPEVSSDESKGSERPTGGFHALNTITIPNEGPNDNTLSLASIQRVIDNPKKGGNQNPRLLDPDGNGGLTETPCTAQDVADRIRADIADFVGRARYRVDHTLQPIDADDGGRFTMGEGVTVEVSDGVAVVAGLAGKSPAEAAKLLDAIQAQLPPNVAISTDAQSPARRPEGAPPESPYLVRGCIIGVSFLGGKGASVGGCIPPQRRRGSGCESPRASLSGRARDAVWLAAPFCSIRIVAWASACSRRARR